MKTLVTAVTCVLLAALPAAQAQTAASPTKSRLYFGGSIGASFGDIDYVSVAPTVGLHVTPKIAVGISPFWVYRNYSGTNDVSTRDYGFDLYGRYRVIPQAFAQLQYSYTDYEYPLFIGGTDRDTYSAVLGGGGYVRPIGGRASLVVSALYDFTYSSDDPAPYDDPWLVNAGVVVGF